MKVKFSINNQQVNAELKTLERALVPKVVNKTVALIGAEGRKVLGPAQLRSSGLHMGRRLLKYRKKEGRHVWGTFSEFSSRHGWYQSTRKTPVSGHNYRIINFSFEKGGYARDSKMTAEGYVSSQLANLFGSHDMTWTKKSPAFATQSYGYRKIRLKPGYKRLARDMSMNPSTIQPAMSKAMRRAEEYWDELVKEEGWEVD